MRAAREQSPAITVTIEGDLAVLHLSRANQRGEAHAPISQWASLAPASTAALGEALSAAEDGRRGSDNRPLVIAGQRELHLHPEFVASLSTTSAQALGLPAPTPLAIDLKSQNLPPDPNFKVDSRWVRPGGQPVRAKVAGAIVESEGAARRIPEPLYSIWLAAQRLGQPLQEADRYAALAALRAAIPEDATTPVDANAFLADLRIHYASAFSLKLGRTGPFDFDPVLFSRPAAERARDDHTPLDEEADSLLAPRQQKLFAEDRFVRAREVRPIYVLRDGEYIFVDPSLRPALNVVRSLQGAPDAEKRRFLSSPRRTLRERLGESEAERTGLDQLFIETDQFSERVAGVDVWRTPALPWVKPGKNSWLPEAFGLRIGEAFISVPVESLGALTAAVERAHAEGAPDVAAKGLLAPGPDGAPPPDRLPVNDSVLDAVRALAPFSSSQQSELSHDEASAGFHEDGPGPLRRGKLFLVVHDNLEDVEFAPYQPDLSPASPLTEDEPVAPLVVPHRLKTQLKPHQIDGLAWLLRCRAMGRSGALLADDMGLGKTLQAIAFMACLQDQAAADHRPRAPVLVVAPTGLLNNWRKEIETHLEPPRLGDIVLAFGSGLKSLREEGGFNARDVESGRASLDAERWHDAGMVLTTYETLRDYHFSFARTRFGLIVYDEVQRLKNPASQLTRAAKTLNTDFVLGMTGTPVENRMQDLWSIIDVISPGLLGSSRDFETRYPASDPDRLKQLKALLCEVREGRPPWMLRRMKDGTLTGLPDKQVVRQQVAMPALQARAYGELVSRAVAGRGLMSQTGMLPLLHAMRGVSLHPVDPDDAPSDLAAYAKESARLSWTLDRLDEIAKAREKALIFLESLKMQAHLAAMIQARWRLPSLPMRINGSVPGPRRQELVDKFQGAPGVFDVMILSPRAGGVGLTLTAANHVIHLSRWWNPAVEDQSTDRCFRIGQTKTVKVYLPLAVHPDDMIGPSSFDLKLDALLERKRALSRDLLAPPESDEGDLNALFESICPTAQPLNGARTEDTPTAPVDPVLTGEAQNASFPVRPAPEATPVARPVLTLQTPRSTPQVRLIEASPGQARPWDEILRPFKDAKVASITIRDPYALAGPREREAQALFVERLRQIARSVEAITVEYNSDAGQQRDAEPEPIRRRDLLQKLESACRGGQQPRLALRGKQVGKNDDFHDREVVVTCLGAGGAAMTHRLLIGRGLIALASDRYECRLTHVPPTA